MKNIQAFPIQLTSGIYAEGMTLRDYFAAKAMQAIISKNGSPSEYHWANGTKDKKPELAQKSYGIADAMLKERSK